MLVLRKLSTTIMEIGKSQCNSSLNQQKKNANRLRLFTLKFYRQKEFFSELKNMNRD